MPLNSLLGAENKRDAGKAGNQIENFGSDCRTTSEPWLIASRRSVAQVALMMRGRAAAGLAAAAELLGKVMKIKALRLTFFVVGDHQIGHRRGGGSFRLSVGLLLALLLLLGLFGLFFLS